MTVPEAIEVLNAALTSLRSGADPDEVLDWIEAQSSTLRQLVRKNTREGPRRLLPLLQTVDAVTNTRDFLNLLSGIDRLLIEQLQEGPYDI